MNEVYRDIEQHIPGLRRYAAVLTRNPADADDLLQDCVLLALSKAHLYESGTNLRAWLFTILRNQHVSSSRRKVRAGVPVDPETAPVALATRPSQEDCMTLNAVDQALQGLPNHQRNLIELVALDGHSYEDVATSYGLAVGTVKSRIARGRSRLRKALERQNNYDSPAVQPWCNGVNGARQAALH